MTGTEMTGRQNQRARTRKDLLKAASRLIEQGRQPTLEDIAEEALVSRATAYRYFSSVEALLVEASFDIAVPEPADLFGDDASDDPVARVQRVDTALHDMILANEAPLRMMLVQTLQRGIFGDDGEDVPLRQNRRTPLIDAALQPARKQFTPATIDTLRKALIVAPNDGTALYALRDASTAIGDTLGADHYGRLFEKAWVGPKPPDLDRL